MREATGVQGLPWYRLAQSCEFRKNKGQAMEKQGLGKDEVVSGEGNDACGTCGGFAECAQDSREVEKEEGVA